MKMQNIKQETTVIPNNFVCKPVLETKINKMQLINISIYWKKDVTLDDDD